MNSTTLLALTFWDTLYYLHSLKLQLNSSDSFTLLRNWKLDTILAPVPLAAGVNWEELGSYYLKPSRRTKPGGTCKPLKVQREVFDPENWGCCAARDHWISAPDLRNSEIRAVNPAQPDRIVSNRMRQLPRGERTCVKHLKWLCFFSAGLIFPGFFLGAC